MSSFGIGSFGFGGSAIGGHMKPKPTKYIFKPRKVRHYPFKHKMLKPKPQPQIVDQWPQPSYAMKPVEIWPQAQVLIDESYLTQVPIQPQPIQLYPSLEDILKLSNPAPVPAPPPPPPPPAELSPNLQGLVKYLTTQLSTSALTPSSLANLKPSYSTWLTPDYESNSLAQAIDTKGIEIIQETNKILSTTESPIFDLDKLLRNPKIIQ